MVIEQVLFVEGRQDKLQILPVLDEPIEIVCTNGTVSASRLEELLAPYEGCDLYVLFDADESGEKSRKLMKRVEPNAIHLYTRREYKQVEHTPRNYLAHILAAEGFAVKAAYLL
ncbi:hypothetical protein [Kurthia senegalensis]|uniref:hypothetical protein n=1 Tax=Kurthia senegalensis TaxID=1033740 RepID=UPI000289D0D9|nr:hypothetical protein [Kurthia senegalensis]